MAVHDLESYRRRRHWATPRRPSRWRRVVIALGLLVLAGSAVLVARSGWPPPTATASGPVATAPTGVCRAHVAHVGPVTCPFAAQRTGATSSGIDWGAPFTLGHRCMSAGTVLLPTGRVVATDPLVDSERRPFTMTFAPGTRAEVLLSLAEEEDLRDRNAFAMLRVGTTRPVRWEEARDTGGGEAYPVDAGTGCFADEEAMQHVTARILAQPSLYDVMNAAGYPRARNVNLCIDPHRGTNLVAFESGLGDGTYVTYAGYDAHDHLVALVTDFELVDLGRGVHPFLEPVQPPQ